MKKGLLKLGDVVRVKRVCQYFSTNEDLIVIGDSLPDFPLLRNEEGCEFYVSIDQIKKPSRLRHTEVSLYRDIKVGDDVLIIKDYGGLKKGDIVRAEVVNDNGVSFARDGVFSNHQSHRRYYKPVVREDFHSPLAGSKERSALAKVRIFGGYNNSKFVIETLEKLGGRNDLYLSGESKRYYFISDRGQIRLDICGEVEKDDSYIELTNPTSFVVGDDFMVVEASDFSKVGEILTLVDFQSDGFHLYKKESGHEVYLSSSRLSSIATPYVVNIATGYDLLYAIRCYRTNGLNKNVLKNVGGAIHEYSFKNKSELNYFLVRKFVTSLKSFMVIEDKSDASLFKSFI